MLDISVLLQVSVCSFCLISWGRSWGCYCWCYWRRRPCSWSPSRSQCPRPRSSDWSLGRFGSLQSINISRLRFIFAIGIPKPYRYRRSSIADPDLNPDSDPPDPHVFGPPGSGSGSIRQRYGSGSGSFTSNLKPSAQCSKAAGCATSVLNQLKRNFHFRDRHIFVNLYKQYVRPHLEFSSQA